MSTKAPIRVPAVHAESFGPDLLTSMEVCEKTGLTYRMLDYWVRRGRIKPVTEAHGSGTARLFSPAVVPQVKALLARIRQCPYDHHGSH